LERLGFWLTGALDHLKVHWKSHLLPGIGFFLVLMGYIVVMFAMMIAGFIVGEEMGEEDLAFVLIMVGVYGSSFLLTILLIPFQLGYMRATIRAARTGEFDARDLLSGLRLTHKGIALMFLMMFFGMFGVLACYVGALFIGALMMFAMPVMADRSVGPIRALQESFQMAKPRYWAIVVHLLAVMALLSVVGYIPLIGMAAVMPLYVVMTIIPYVDVTREEYEASGSQSGLLEP